MKQLIYNSSFFVILFIALASVTLIVCDWMKKSAAKQAFIKIDGDGKDYYSYLTAAFITHNLAKLETEDNFVVETPTGNIKLHPVGIAVLELPFFALGYMAALMSNQATDGYSLPFQLSISFAALCFLLVGIRFSYKLLKSMGFNSPIISVSLLLLFFGTTLLNYTVTEPSMSHIYSFALIAAFAYHTHQLNLRFSGRTVLILSALLGFIILVRPVNVIVLLMMPFFFNSFQDFSKTVTQLWARKKLLLSALLTVSAIYSIQCLVWFYQTGHFFQQSYSGQGFYFLHPQFLPMLFGFQSGIFIYTPLLLIVFPALLVMHKTNSYKAWSLLLFLVLMIYVFSSWWCWTYFDGVGTRPVVDFYVLAAVCLCYILRALHSLSKKWSVGIALTLCALFNLIVCYQYKAGIIQGTGMNFEKFNYTFLKTSSDYKEVLGGSYDLAPYSKEKKQSFKSYSNDFNTEKNSFFNYSQKEFGLEYKSGNVDINSRRMHIKISFDRLQIKPNATKEVIVALSLNDPNNTCKLWQSFRLDDVPAEKPCANWKHYDYAVTLGSNIRKTDQLSVFVWNREKQPFGIDNFKIELFDYGHIN